MRPPAAWVDRIASSLAFYPPSPASYRIKRQTDGRRELYVAPSRESRLPPCAFAEAALLPRDGGRKQVAAALIPAPSSSLPGSAARSRDKRRVILFAHGNAVDLAQQLPFLRELSAALAKGGAPCAVACFDYQGYGESRRVSPAEKDEDEEMDRGGEEGRNGGAGKSGASCACDPRSAPPPPPPSAADAAALPRQALCPDHGAAPDSTTADALLDGAAALAWLLDEKGFAPSEVVLYGQSLGSGVATSLAVALCGRERERLREEERQRRKMKKKGGGAAPTAGLAPSPSSGCLAAAGLILHSPLASGLRVLKPSWRWWPAALDIFPVARAAAKLSSPGAGAAGGGGGGAGRGTKCLVIHGDADDVVPFENGRAVFDALPPEARVEPLWVKGGGHCDLEGRAAFLPRLLQFLKDEI